MAIDTKAKRNAALLESSVVFPDGAFSATDRANEISQYFAATAAPPVVSTTPAPGLPDFTINHTVSTYFEICPPGSTIPLLTTNPSASNVNTDIRIIDGKVTYDKQADVRARLDMTLVDPTETFVPTTSGDVITPWGNEIRAYHGVKFDDGTYWHSFLGVFRITDVVIDEHDGEVTIQVTGQDRSRNVSRNVNTIVYQHAFGVSFGQAIQTMLARQWPAIQFNDTPANWANLQNDHAVATPLQAQASALTEGVDFWSEARKMAKNVGCELFFNRDDGICYFVRDPAFAYTSGTGLLPVYSFYEGRDAIVTGATRRLSDSVAFNEVIITGEGNLLSGLPIRSVPATDTDVNSPTYISGPYGTVPLLETNSLIASQAALNDFAQLRLRQSIGAQEALSFRAVPVPWLKVDDLIQFTRTRLGIVTANYIIDKLTIPLKSDQLMDVTLRQRRSF